MAYARRVVPELVVADVGAAQAWYAAVLGATPMWTWQGTFGAVRLGDAELYLVRDRSRGPVTCYLHVDTVAAVHAQVAAGLADSPPVSGGAVLEELGDREWAMREFALGDPWHNVLRIGQPLAPVGTTAGFAPAAKEEDPRG